MYFIYLSKFLSKIFFIILFLLHKLSTLTKVYVRTQQQYYELHAGSFFSLEILIQSFLIGTIIIILSTFRASLATFKVETIQTINSFRNALSLKSTKLIREEKRHQTDFRDFNRQSNALPFRVFFFFAFDYPKKKEKTPPLLLHFD